MRSVDFEPGFDYFPVFSRPGRETRVHHPLASKAALLPAMRPKTAPDMRPVPLA
jgi:hypothetical protein